MQKADWNHEITFTIQKGDHTRNNEEAQKLYQHANDLKVRISGIDAKMETLDDRTAWWRSRSGRPGKKCG
ncbi:MAG: hypothetical protein U0Q18_16710 [Bryobacteraceae bacterium]